MENDEIVYNKLSKLLNIKFKAQLNDSGIIFEKLVKIYDLISEEEYYMLVLNSLGVNFRDKDEFLINFAKLLERSIAKIEQEVQDFELECSNSRWVDENAVFMQHEEFGSMLYKQSKLLKKIMSLRS